MDVKTPVRRVVHVAKHGLHEDGRDFDRSFWAAMTGEERMVATWQAALDWAALRGMDEHQLRLQRSVVRVFRR
jgi:hypothetical protein